LQEFEARHANTGGTPAKIEPHENAPKSDGQSQPVLKGKAFEIPAERLAMN
jgi:hypothetical protein